MAIFTNAAPTGLPEALTQVFLDLIEKGHVEKNWISIWNERFQSLLKITETLPKPQNKSDSLPLKAYLGDYFNPYFGKARVIEQNGTLSLTIGPQPMIFPLKHWNRDVFTLETREENRSGITPIIFTIDAEELAKSFFLEAFNVDHYGSFQRLESPKTSFN